MSRSSEHKDQGKYTQEKDVFEQDVDTIKREETWIRSSSSSSSHQIVLQMLGSGGNCNTRRRERNNQDVTTTSEFCAKPRDNGCQ